MEKKWEFEKVVLGNGLTIFYLRIPNAPTISKIILRAGGARYDPEGKEGLAHLFEHMLGKGSSRLPTETVLEIFSLQHGIWWNAKLDLDAVVVEGIAPSKETENLLFFLSSLLGKWPIDEAALEKEKRIILTEMHTWQKLPSWVEAELEVKKAIFGTHRFARIPIESGTPATIGKITLQDVIAHRRKFVIPSNLFIVIVTSHNLPSIIEKIEENFNLPSSSQKIEYPVPLNDFPKPSRNLLVFSYSELEKTPRRRAIGDTVEMNVAIPTGVAEVFWDIIAPLLKIVIIDLLRYKLGLIYEVSMVRKEAIDISLFALRTKTLAGKGKQVQAVILQILEEFKNIEPIIFRLVKQRRLEEFLNAPPAIVANEAVATVKLYGQPNLPEKIQALKKCTFEKATEWVKTWLSPDRIVTKLIVP